MATQFRIGVDLANVVDEKGRCFATLAWGDEVSVSDLGEKRATIRLTRLARDGDATAVEEVDGFIERPARASGLTFDDVLVRPGPAAARVLRVDFVDVQQGDGSVIESPAGKVVLVDGGDNQLFARYLAARFPRTTDERPKEVDCILVTHGDADHFMGLTEIHGSEGLAEARKRLFIHPARVYHNGLVKRPTTRAGKRVPDGEMFGETAKAADGALVVTGLVNDLRRVADEDMNEPFRAWKRALKAFAKRGKIAVRRLAAGDHDAFDFLADEGIGVEVLGPITTRAGGRAGLAFLGTPKRRIAREPGQPDVTFTGISPSHTINGHSVILRLTYGKFRFLFAGDLNEQSERTLTAEHEAKRLDLTAEVFKVPHHGSADFSIGFLRAVSPVVSVVSSGDESERKEFIHPRATLLGALSRHARPEVEEPLIFVTELAAFFKMEGFVTPAEPKGKATFFAFSRKAFGMVKARTDGERLLVYTYSGKDDLKEAYAFRFDAAGRVVPDVVRKC